VNRYLRTKAVDKDQRVSDTAGIFLAAVLEYLAVELLKSTGKIAHESKRSRISPRHIALAIMNNPDLDELVHASIAQGGVLPNNIEAALLPKGKKGKDGAPAKKKRKKSSSKSKKKKSSPKRKRKVTRNVEEEEPEDDDSDAGDPDWDGDDEEPEEEEE